MKTIFSIQTGIVTLLSTVVFAGLTACDTDTVEREGGKLPDKEPLETTYGMLRSSSATDRTIDVLLTEGGNGFVVKIFIFNRQSRPLTRYRLMHGLMQPYWTIILPAMKSNGNYCLKQIMSFLMVIHWIFHLTINVHH